MKVTLSLNLYSYIEKQEVSKKAGGVVWFTPSKEQLHRYGDGGVAIIDQWIAAHAKYFTGMGHCNYHTTC